MVWSFKPPFGTPTAQIWCAWSPDCFALPFAPGMQKMMNAPGLLQLQEAENDECTGLMCGDLD